MKDILITLETAKLAKEKGFDSPCAQGFYETIEHTLDCGRGDVVNFPYQAPRTLSQPAYGIGGENVFIGQAPSQSLLQKWLREVHNIHIDIQQWELISWYFYIKDGRNPPVKSIRIEVTDDSKWEFNSYEEALEIGLQEALKLI